MSFSCDSSTSFFIHFPAILHLFFQFHSLNHYSVFSWQARYRLLLVSHPFFVILQLFFFLASLHDSSPVDNVVSKFGMTIVFFSIDNPLLSLLELPGFLINWYHFLINFSITIYKLLPTVNSYTHQSTRFVDWHFWPPYRLLTQNWSKPVDNWSTTCLSIDFWYTLYRHTFLTLKCETVVDIGLSHSILPHRGGMTGQSAPTVLACWSLWTTERESGYY